MFQSAVPLLFTIGDRSGNVTIHPKGTTIGASFYSCVDTVGETMVSFPRQRHTRHSRVRYASRRAFPPC